MGKQTDWLTHEKVQTFDRFALPVFGFAGARTTFDAWTEDKSPADRILRDTHNRTKTDAAPAGNKRNLLS